MESNKKRTTTRSNAGKPPARLGVNNPVDEGQPMTSKSILHSDATATRTSSPSTRSNATVVTARSNRSVSSSVRQSEIDLLTEQQIGELEAEYETHEQQVEQIDFTVSTIMDQIKFLTEQLTTAEEDSAAQLKQQINEQQTLLRDKRKEVQKERIVLKFELKTLQRKKSQLRREAEHRKQVVEEEYKEDDNQSQHLSDTDEEVFEEDPDLRKERLEFESNLQQQQQSSDLAQNRIRLEEKLRRQTEIAAEALQAAKNIAINTSKPNLSDDELLIRLRNLNQPISTGADQQTLTKGQTALNNPVVSQNVIDPSNNILSNESIPFSTENLSDQFAQVMSKAFEKLGNNSGGSNNTDRFLARQVQGRDLPVFTGKPEEWPTFVTAFENSTAGCGYSNMDNLPRLQKCIKGEALKTIQCLLVRAENVPVILEKLKMRFGRPEHIVRALINKAKDVPTFKDDRLDLLIEFGLAVDNLVETIKALKCLEHLTSPQLLDQFSRKLPVSLRTKWIEYVTSDPLRQENLENFAKWISIQTEIACRICPPKATEDHMNNKHWEAKKARRRDDQVWAVVDADSKTVNKNPRISQCLYCDTKGHQVSQCRKLERAEVDERYKFVKSKRLCFCCLRLGHSSIECRSKKECGKNGCKRTHHPMIHRDLPQQPEKKREASDEHRDSETVGHSYGAGQINLMILPVLIKGPKGSLSTFAMLDPGATATVIDDYVAEKLGLQGERKPFVHCGLHPRMEEQDSRSVKLELLNSKGNKLFQLKNVRTKKYLNLPIQSVRKSLLKKWNHLKDLNIECYVQGNPTILIGLDNMNLCTTQEIRKGSGNAPAAGRTELGWVLLGKVDEVNRSDFCGMIFEKPDEDLHQLVKQHFTTEAFGVKVTNVNPRSKEDIYAQEIMDRTIKRVGDHWETGLLWKNNEVQLPNTKQIAMTRLLQMERKMDRDPQFAIQYIKKIEEYQQKGFARILSTAEAESEGVRTFYLPHFMAFNPKKPKKLRFVFDAAAKVQGVSLNDKLLKGPDKLTSLPAVLLKFRQRKIGITADIKDMFHRVKVRTEDASSQRFLWRGMNRDKAVDVLEMGVLIFGAACSPACAQEVKNLNAAEFQQQYPEAVKAILNNHYVDDYLDSVDTVEEALKMFHEVRNIHLKGSFDICNWISNSKVLLDSIPKDLHAPGVKNMDLEGEAERVLRLFWKPEQDIFTFSITFLKINKETLNQQRLPTKRELLALVMSIYDPLGFLSIFTVKAKIILQETWRTGIGWDDEIPVNLSNKWERWNKELKRINTFSLPRCYAPEFSTATKIELHVLCDASEQAFGAVAYFKIETLGAVRISFVMAKAKVAPTKHLTIPRLELQAAVLGTRLATFIKLEHEVKLQRTVYWSDSRTVICWLKADGKRFQQFVSCTIGEILEATEPNDWRWVPTKLNVADEMTRDNQESDWGQDSRWINGPEFLKLPEDMWPCEPQPSSVIPDEIQELKREHICLVNTQQQVIDVTRFSSCLIAVRTIAFVLRFIYNCRNPNMKVTTQALTMKEVKQAEHWWWRKSQAESFGEEIQCLRKNKQLPIHSGLSGVNVVLEEDEILRVRGRLDNAPIPSDTRRPIVLDRKHRYTQLLIALYHTNAGHHGQEKVVNEIRQQYYIPRIRIAVRKAWTDCQDCKIKRALPLVPLMGQLPSVRLESYVSPFKNVGLDYFGPLSVTIGRRHEKRWVALFTCLSTRAVHLELTSSLDTDSCIMAIRRFVGRRGHPVNIYSDNGTNFVGANIELKKSLAELNQQQMMTECTLRGISWHFIPPKAPHMGGSWERLVKAVKVALHATLKESHPKEETLRTFLVEAEHTVNCHPLTHVPVDPDDPEALTPNHFLIGRSSNDQIPGHFQEADLCLRKQWRHAQQLANHFWKRWVKEYLPTLLRRTKWTQQQEPIQVGDVVLVIDDQLTRNFWPMGIVVKLYPGKDGIIRVVDVRQISGIFRRPVSKLCKLDVYRPSAEKEDLIDK